MPQWHCAPLRKPLNLPEEMGGHLCAHLMELQGTGRELIYVEQCTALTLSRTSVASQRGLSLQQLPEVSPHLSPTLPVPFPRRAGARRGDVMGNGATVRPFQLCRVWPGPASHVPPSGGIPVINFQGVTWL